MTSIHETVNNAQNATVSTETAQNECLTEFIRTGRTGRRNAVPDVYIDQNISVTTASITESMFKFDFHDNKKNTSDKN